MKKETIMYEDVLKSIKSILKKNHKQLQEIEWIIIKRTAKTKALNIIIPLPDDNDKRLKKAIILLERELFAFKQKYPYATIVQDTKVLTTNLDLESYQDNFVHCGLQNLENDLDGQLSNVWHYDDSHSLECERWKRPVFTKKEENRITVMTEDKASLEIIERIIDSNPDKRIIVIDFDIWNTKSILQRLDGKEHFKKAQHSYMDWLKEEIVVNGCKNAGFPLQPKIFKKSYIKKMLTVSKTKKGVPYQLILSHDPDKGLSAILSALYMLRTEEMNQTYEGFNRSHLANIVYENLKPDLLIFRGSNRLNESINMAAEMGSKNIIMDQHTHQLITSVWKELGVMDRYQKKINLLVVPEHPDNEDIEKVVAALMEKLREKPKE